MMTTNDPKLLKRNNINDIMSCCCTSAKFEGKMILYSSYSSRHFFLYQTRNFIVESAFPGYLHFFFKRQVSFLYHFCAWQYWEEVLYYQCLNLQSIRFILKICPYLSQLSLRGTFLFFLIQRDSGEVVFVMFISTFRADWKWEVQGCMKAASVPWPQGNIWECKSLVQVVLTWCSFQV